MPAEAPRHGTETERLPLILLPGTLCDARVFAPLQHRLPGVPTRVLLTTEAHTLHEAAERVLAQAPERFALLGFSLGGMVAIETALLAPERVASLALLSTTPLPVPPERHSTRRAAVEEARTLGPATFLRERLWPDYCGTTPTPAILPILEAMADSLGHAVFARQTEMALAREDFRPRLRHLRCPTFVLAGAEDRISTPDTQHELLRSLPSGAMTLLRHAGHFALLELPDETASAVAAWFNTAERNEKRGATNATSQPANRESE